MRLRLDEADDHQKYDRTDHGINDRADEAGERQESQLREEPDADESADDADDDVPDQSETKTAHDLPGQPACDRADDDHDDNAVYSDHDILPRPGTRSCRDFICNLGCNPQRQRAKRSPSGG